MANITGTSGDDLLFGTDDDDIIEGGDGNDIIDGRLGADVIHAGAGDDVVRFSAVRFSSNSTNVGLIDGGDGFDTIDLRGVSPVTVGPVDLGVFGAYVGSQKFHFRFIEQILLGSGFDYIDVGTGTGAAIGIVVRAGGGNDQITATGQVSVYGEDGDDDFFVSGYFSQPVSGGIMDGGSGYDTLKTNVAFNVDLSIGLATGPGGSFRVAGFERLLATPSDTTTTYIGNDDANTFAVNPLFATNSGNMSFSGRGGDDSLSGGIGNDFLDGGDGNDSLAGGAGDDTLVPGLGINIVDGGTGTDTAVLLGRYADYNINQSSAIAATFSRNAGPAEINSFNNVERYRFTDGVILTLRQGGSDFFDLSSKVAPVTLGTGIGDDSISIGAGLTAADRLDGGAGLDQVGLQGNYNGSNRLVLEAGTLSNVEVLAFLPNGNYDITSTDATVAAGQVFTVFGGNLTSTDSMTFVGSLETDGSFLMFGGLGVDRLTGGANNDAFYFGPQRFGANDVVTGGAGVDQLGLDGLTGNLTLRSANADVETVALLSGTNGISNTYGTIFVDDSWVAAGATKTITAVTSFQDQLGPVMTSLVIDGSSEANGNLRILAGSGDDTLLGGAGNDVLFGGLGRDRMSGGAGADTFAFNSAAESNVGIGNGGVAVLSYDTLFGFAQGTDTIQIDGQTYATITAGQNGRLDDATFNDDLAAAVGNMTGSAGVTFTATSGSHAGETFLVFNTDGQMGYQAGSDLVLHLAPASDLTPASMILQA